MLAIVMLVACGSSASPTVAPVSGTTIPATSQPPTTTEPAPPALPPETGVTVRTVRGIDVWQPTGSGGPWPLIAFAHGYNVTPQFYDRLLRVWAAAGYVVAAPASNEPAAIRAAIDILSNDDAVDPTRVGVAGHSDGATIAAHIAFDPAEHDSRVRAVVALVSDPLDNLGPLSGPPLFLEQGDSDTISPQSNGDSFYEQVTSSKWYLLLHGAGHSPPITERTQWTPIVDQSTIAFLDRYLAGRTADDAALVVAGRQDPNLASFFVG